MAISLERIVRNPDYMIGAAIMLLFAAVGMYIATLFPTALRNPPVFYTIVEQDEFAETCPGDVHRLSVLVSIKEPSIIEVTTVFVELNTQQIMPIDDPYYHTRTRAYSRSAEYVQPVTWTVPPVPAGNYLRVTAATSKFIDTKPAIIEVPFTVGENCE